jgi:hypothetical protein
MKVLVDIEDLIDPSLLSSLASLEDGMHTTPALSEIIVEYFSLVCGLCLDGSGQDPSIVEMNRNKNFQNFLGILNSSRSFLRILFASLLGPEGSTDPESAIYSSLVPKCASLIPAIIEICAIDFESQDVLNMREWPNILQKIAVIMAPINESSECLACSQFMLFSICTYEYEQAVYSSIKIIPSYVLSRFRG